MVIGEHIFRSEIRLAAYQWQRSLETLTGCEGDSSPPPNRHPTVGPGFDFRPFEPQAAAASARLLQLTR